MGNVCLSTKALSVGYAGRTVVEDISLQVRSGEILSVIGPNGSGKTTLLKTLIRQLPPISGSIELAGRPLTELSDREVSRSLATVLTGRPEPELMRCGELIALGRYPYTGTLGILSDQDRRAVASAMELVGVSSLADRDFGQISDGQRQRVLLCRAICQEPEVLILDEPTTYLDLKHKLGFMRLLLQLAREQNLAVMLSLHDLALAQAFSDRVICLQNGRVDRCGSAAEVFSGSYIEQLFDLAPGDAELFL